MCFHAVTQNSCHIHPHICLHIRTQIQANTARKCAMPRTYLYIHTHTCKHIQCAQIKISPGDGIYANMHMCKQIRRHTNTCIWTLHTSTHISKVQSSHWQSNTRIHQHTHMHTCTYIQNMHTRTRTSTHLHIQTHSRTHAHTRAHTHKLHTHIHALSLSLTNSVFFPSSQGSIPLYVDEKNQCVYMHMCVCVLCVYVYA